jgi:hypothetical protein
MASSRFFGAIGFANSVEIADGVWEDVITENEYYGDVVRNTRHLQDGQKVNDDLTVNNSISIVADPYASEHFFAMRYVKWAGALWIVDDVEVRSPRLILRLGGVYNGPTPASSTP